MRTSYIWAGIITLAIAGWLASGEIIIGGQGDPSAANSSQEVSPATGASQAVPAADQDRPFRVRARTLTATERTATLSVRGRTEADQRVLLRAQTSGLIEDVLVRQGDPVKAGEVICRIEAGSREAHVLRAEAAVAQAALDFEGASRLQDKGYAAEARVRAAKAALDAARADLHERQLDLARTRIVAPFDGVVETRPAEIGMLLNVGDVCAEVVAHDPMLVVAQVSERDVGKLKPGMPGRARLVTGQTVDGTLSYIAPSADPATRTFRIELSVPNPDGELRDGVTAELFIDTETALAHRFSPAILALDDSGVIGVRTIVDGNKVAFVPVHILGSEDGKVWVSGLPDSVTIITVGQNYVSDGETVEPVFETAQNAEPTTEAAR
ncbi:multidrug efflux system membrane fusion protein [Tepidamorphus gemmatus]|uniref:Multidrug efflux system membrane fusion protein n=1 Tax=Tepidamorphus gemmatus TaxID=747076 RepID=A0A4R3M2P8_9HYPH|nr:efflux RND transporter periplasmic adaptor subunit [Tepidamorphus gemmatus]TCT05415.1 multidrug efflux system membrane fusion protein [Tepidamorphus gemmatus]